MHNIYDKYKPQLDFIDKYSKASNAATGSKFDSNANVETKNVTTLSGEIHKEADIGINRLRMINKLTELFGVEYAEEYIRQLDSHEIYRHDETHPLYPYCVSITLYPFISEGLKTIGAPSTAPKNLNSFCGNFINLVFAVAAQFAGAVATPEFLTYLDYFIRLEYGDDYYLKEDLIIDSVSKRPKTMGKMIKDCFEQVVYSLNEPAAARNFQSVFWNIAYFDKTYFDAIYEDFVFPDGDEPKWESVSWLQKYFMKWFNEERRRNYLTFPVETVNLVYDKETKKYKDEDWADFTAEMWSKGHSFFCYNSDSADSLSSCCFSADTMTLTKSSDGVNFMTFKDIYDSKWEEKKKNFTIFHNGSWVKGKPIKLPNRQMYKIITENNKEIIVSDNHLNPTLRGDVETKDLNTTDYLLFNCRQLDTFAEKDQHLTYEQGFAVGAFLGDGSFGSRQKDGLPNDVNYSQNVQKFARCIEMVNAANKQLGGTYSCTLSEIYNNVYPVRIASRQLVDFIIYWTNWKEGTKYYNKELNMDCLLQSYEFRKGILDGWYNTDGGNSNRCYTTSKKLCDCMEALITSLGYNSIIDCSDRTDETVIIRGAEYNRNYPLYCIRWYDSKNKRVLKDVYKVVNNSIYFKIKSIDRVKYDDEIYCFEMKNQDEPYFTLPCGLITHNCRLKNGITDNVFSYTLGAGGISTGSKAVITINVNRLVQQAQKDGVSISEKMREQTLKNHKYLIAFNEILKDELKNGMLPIYDAGYISLEKQYLTTGINGLIEGAEFLGIDISPNEEYYKYCEEVLSPIMEENKKARTKEIMFNTEYVPAENLGVKNAKWDKEDGLFSPRECYNSYFFKVEDETLSIIDKMMMHGDRVVRYLDGGSACHINLSEHLSKQQYRKGLDIAAKCGCSYYTYNIPNTECINCGHISKHYLDKCPICGSDNLDYLTRIIGYVKRISKYSESRQKEAAKRHYNKKEDM